MPDDELGARRAEEAAQAAAFLQERWTGSRVCPICGTQKWNTTALLEVRHLQVGEPRLVDQVVPAFAAVCETCGYMIFFSARRAGIAPEGEEDRAVKAIAEALQRGEIDAQDALARINDVTKINTKPGRIEPPGPPA